MVPVVSNNVIERLFVVTSQSPNDRRAYTWRLDSEQQALFRNPIVH